jgi:long-subunit acyl-CoA synthetase (AMP-forming)
VYNTSTPDQIRQRIENSDCRIYVTESQFLPIVRQALIGGSPVEHVVVIDGGGPGTMPFADVAQAGGDGFDFEARWRAVRPEDVVTIIYTSGTTGPPKGAQWTHHNVMSMLRSWAKVLPLPTQSVSYLPMAHAGERMLTHYMPLGEASTVTCVNDYKRVLEAVAEAHPDFLATVPRTWVKLRTAIEAKIDAEPEHDLRAALRAAITSRLDIVESGSEGGSEDEALDLLRERILGPWGLDNLRAAFIGSAPPPPDVIRYFLALGVPLLEAYGLTEATGFGAIWPRLTDFKPGTIGKPLPGVELRFAQDGEILLRSDMNMAGYRKQPEESSTTLDAQGWLHTGDLGDLDEDGFVRLIGRKKEIIINQAGKNMSPSNIESAIKTANPLLGQVVAIGDQRPYVVALITLDADGAAALALKHGLPDASVAAVATAPPVIEEVARAVETGNAELSRVEQIKKFDLLDHEWHPDSDELTPTMKLKRDAIRAKYADRIDALYQA